MALCRKCAGGKLEVIKDDLLADQGIILDFFFLNVWLADARTEPTVKFHVSQASSPESITQTLKSYPLFGLVMLILAPRGARMSLLV